MKNKVIVLLAVCCLSSRLVAEEVEITLSSSITVNKEQADAILAKLKTDSQELTRKYANAEGVAEVETTVTQNRCDECGDAEHVATPKEEASEDCGCTNKEEEVKCGCGKPKDKSAEVAACDECQGHNQVADKVERNGEGQTVCSDCKEQLRSCSSCCKEKCCKKCKKCCSSCSSSSSSCCCH